MPDDEPATVNPPRERRSRRRRERIREEFQRYGDAISAWLNGGGHD